MKTSAHLLFALCLLLLPACTHRSASHTMASLMEAVDNARQAYYEEVALGHVSDERQAEIDAAIATYQAAVGPAIFAVRNDLSQVPPQDLVEAAFAVIDLIQPLTE